jgi:hypothetical protein
MKGIITMNGLPFFDNNLLEIWRGIMSVIKQGKQYHMQLQIMLGSRWKMVRLHPFMRNFWWKIGF